MPHSKEDYGVVDGDPIAIIEFIFLAFILIYFVGNSVLSPINGASTINGVNPQTQFATAYTNLKWFLYMLIPIVPYIMIKGWSELSHREDKQNEES